MLHELFKRGHGRFSELRGAQAGTRPIEIGRWLKDTFDAVLYGKLLKGFRVHGRPKDFHTNESFWMPTLNGLMREGMRVRLNDFHVTEWVPISPGRYFSPVAAGERNHALALASREGDELLPEGKSHMVLGGVGTIRLKSRFVEGRRTYFCSATSTGITHEGIPILVPGEPDADLLDAFVEAGGCVCDVQGIVRVLPEELSMLTARFPDSNQTREPIIPKYALAVEDLRPKRVSRKGQLLSTAAVIFRMNFESGTERGSDGDCWSFYAFDPAKGLAGVRAAADWLQDYAERYAKFYNEAAEFPVLTDFDEHHDLFSHPVRFPLKQIVEGRIDPAILDIAAKRYGLHININNVNAKTFNMHQQNTQNIYGGTFHGPVAVTMRKCTTTIGRQPDSERKQLLSELQNEVKELAVKLPPEMQKEAIDNLEKLVDSTVDEKPKRPWYDVSARGLIEASKFVKDFTGNIVGTIGQLGKLLWPDYEVPKVEEAKTPAIDR
jgi:hypothetical protein